MCGGCGVSNNVTNGLLSARRKFKSYKRRVRGYSGSGVVKAKNRLEKQEEPALEPEVTTQEVVE